MEQEEQEPQISCEVDKFEAAVCGPDRMAVLFLGKETKNLEDIISALSEEDLGMKVSVLINDEKCNPLREKYGIEAEGTQLVVFQDCEKKAAVSLEEDPQGQVARLKDELEEQERPVFEDLTLEAVRGGLREDMQELGEEPILGAVQPEEVQTGEEED